METIANSDRGAWKLMDLSALTRGLSDVTLATVEYAYQSVPWLYRACTLRAQAVSSLPWDIVDESDTPLDVVRGFSDHADWLHDLLYLAELGRTLYGAAYFLLERNRVGAMLTPRYVPAPLVTPDVDETGRIRSFRVALLGGGAERAPDTVAWTWAANPFSERSPGIAPASVALQSAGILLAISQMVTRYFATGAVPITAVLVPPTASRADRERVEGWLTRVASGVRNAMKFLAISKDTEFKQIGSSLRDAVVADLTPQQRDDVAVALGVPPTVIDATSANYATASTEMLGFYLTTVLPEADAIAAHLTRRMFARSGARLVYHRERVEVLQTAQLDQARVVQSLTGGQAIMTVDEARSWIDLPPLTPEPEPEPEPEIESVRTMRAWRALALEQVRAGSPVSVGAPFDHELRSASSTGMVRRIFDAHWPRDDWRSQALMELRRLNDHLEHSAGNGTGAKE